MSKREVSPDLSYKIINRHLALFTDEEIADIKDLYGFYSNYSLMNQLDDASYRFTTATDSVAVSAKKKALIRVVDSAQRLRESLDKSAQVRAYVTSSINEISLSGDLLAVENAYRVAACHLAGVRTKPGTKTNSAYHGYIRGLHSIYKEGTGCDDRYTRNEYTGECTGQFLDFLSHCLTIIGRCKDKNTIARDISKALRTS